MSNHIYDNIGKTYDMTRQADPDILAKIIHHLHPNLHDVYLDVGCGTGNYTNELYKKSVKLCGLDISKEMLSKAHKKNSHVIWVHGDARNMPFPDGTFGGATCILATHHINDIKTAFREIYRVIHSGNFVILTSFPEQVDAFWLKVYFPKMIAEILPTLCNFENLSQGLKSAGFSHITSEKCSVTEDTRDLFMAAGKYRPSIYLDPHVRAGISAFALTQHQQEIAAGLVRLKADIDSGKINDIIAEHETDLGEYVFVVCRK